MSIAMNNLLEKLFSEPLMFPSDVINFDILRRILIKDKDDFSASLSYFNGVEEIIPGKNDCDFKAGNIPLVLAYCLMNDNVKYNQYNIIPHIIHNCFYVTDNTPQYNNTFIDGYNNFGIPICYANPKLTLTSSERNIVMSTQRMFSIITKNYNKAYKIEVNNPECPNITLYFIESNLQDKINNLVSKNKLSLSYKNRGNFIGNNTFSMDGNILPRRSYLFIVLNFDRNKYWMCENCGSLFDIQINDKNIIAEHTICSECACSETNEYGIHEAKCSECGKVFCPELDDVCSAIYDYKSSLNMPLYKKIDYKYYVKYSNDKVKLMCGDCYANSDDVFMLIDYETGNGRIESINKYAKGEYEMLYHNHPHGEERNIFINIDNYEFSKVSLNHHKCQHCGKIFLHRLSLNQGDSFFCEKCVKELDYIECNICGSLIDKKDAIASMLDPDNHICRCCFAKEQQNYSHDDPLSIRSYILNHFWNPKHVNFLSSKIDEFDTKDKNKLYLGFELEAGDVATTRKAVRAAFDIISQYSNNYEYFYCKRDGSIPDYGFELVTMPITLGAHHEKCDMWSGVCKSMLLSGLKSNNATSSCGLHIHASRNFLTDSQWAFVDWFVSKTRSSWEKIARRDECHWSNFEHQTNLCHIDFVRLYGKSNGNRYQAVNFENNKTVEFRMFRGTLNPYIIISTLEAIDALCRFAKTQTKINDIIKYKINKKHIFNLLIEFANKYPNRYKNFLSYFKKTKQEIIRLATQAERTETDTIDLSRWRNVEIWEQWVDN